MAVVKEKEKRKSQSHGPSESKQVQGGQLVNSHVADKQLPSRRERASEKNEKPQSRKACSGSVQYQKKKIFKNGKEKVVSFWVTRGNLSCMQFYKLEAQQATAPREGFLGRISALSH